MIMILTIIMIIIFDNNETFSDRGGLTIVAAHPQSLLGHQVEK